MTAKRAWGDGKATAGAYSPVKKECFVIKETEIDCPVISSDTNEHPADCVVCSGSSTPGRALIVETEEEPKEEESQDE